MTAASRKPVEEKLGTTASPKTKICWPCLVVLSDLDPVKFPPEKKNPALEVWYFFESGKAPRDAVSPGWIRDKALARTRQANQKPEKKNDKKTGGRLAGNRRKVSERVGRCRLLRARAQWSARALAVGRRWSVVVSGQSPVGVVGRGLVARGSTTRSAPLLPSWGSRLAGPPAVGLVAAGRCGVGPASPGWQQANDR